MSEWISVEDRKPDVRHPMEIGGLRSDDVLVWVDDWKHGDGWLVAIAVLTDTGGWIGDRSWSADDVSHWMPLPDPPTDPVSLEKLAKALAVTDEVSAQKR